MHFAIRIKIPRIPSFVFRSINCKFCSCLLHRLQSTTTGPISKNPGATTAQNNSNGTLLPQPQRIILLRHGESENNRSESVSSRIPEWKVPLTRRGLSQARRAGLRLHTIVGSSSVHIYHSPYLRAVQTTVEVLKGLEPLQVKSVREEPRVAEQQFGNLQDMSTMQKSIEDRVRFGRFFYRFPNGEAGLDVYSRVSGFIGTLRHARLAGPGSTVVIVTHGLAIRLFLMRWFRWTVEQFEETRSPGLCDMVVMELAPEDGSYRLTDSTLKILGRDHLPPGTARSRAANSRAVGYTAAASWN